MTTLAGRLFKLDPFSKESKAISSKSPLSVINKCLLAEFEERSEFLLFYSSYFSKMKEITRHISLANVNF
jgi:hypothetical protein